MFRPSHSRNPSAPVVVRPTHTPGLLSLSKPAQPVVRPQTAHQQQRQPRSSPRGKLQQKSPQLTQAQAQPSEEAKKTSSPMSKSDNAVSEKTNIQLNAVASPDKPPRGRQAGKLAKEKAQRRSASSSSRVPARRPPHQPSPPPSTRIPSQAEVSPKYSSKSSRPIAHVPAADFSDPFIDNVVSTRDTKGAETAKAASKAPSFHSPPPLAQPSGKLARRRQLNGRAPSTPTSKPVPQRKERVAALVGTVTDKPSDAVTSTPVRRSSVQQVHAVDWESFPVCDDSADQANDSDDTPPTTPIRESVSVPPKRVTQAWRPADGFENAPRTAPLSSTVGFPFVPPSPAPTPTPAQRRRNHRRAPSEGVFHMSMDEDSSSSSSDVFTSYERDPVVVSRRRVTKELLQARANAIHGTASSAPQVGFFAGSMFQNSPSPEELPPPSF